MLSFLKVNLSVIPSEIQLQILASNIAYIKVQFFIFVYRS
jgi:hypothetical protein